MKKPSFLYRNSLSIVFLSFMLMTLAGQYWFGYVELNKSLEEKGWGPVSLSGYFFTGHFIQSTFENWESEFFQMGLYVALTVFLRQKGSAESKSLEGKEEVDKTPVPSPDAPWPVRKGGIYLAVYQYSLSIAFFILFWISFLLHAYGTWLDLKSEESNSMKFYEVFLNNRLWYESFQNWQSEFLSVASIVILSIYLRQKGSPESKPVDAPHSQTGK